MKNIGILGSTGSVGRQALDVIEKHSEKFNVVFLTANSNIDLLIEQAKKFNPQYVCINHIKDKEILKSHIDTKILIGKDDLLNLCEIDNVDIILNSIVGYHGMEPTLKILNSGIDLALSNKESIVQAGHLVMNLVKKKKLNIFPVDSEHSALWQCMIGEKKKNIKKMILTGSGGPFRLRLKKDFSTIKKTEALKHPNWDMGNKITIDSATMMNKGFELIEAFWLFDIEINKIDIVVHPQSIIHSMIEFCDGSIKAQLSQPDMRLPIQFALSYPERYQLDNLEFDINKFSNLSFEPVDLDKFECIKLAYEAIESGGSYPIVLNVANDVLVDLFLKDCISFNTIPIMIDKAMNAHEFMVHPNIKEIKFITKWTENYIKEQIKA